MRNLKQIFSETSRTIQKLTMRIDFEVIIFFFETIMAIGKIKFCQEPQSHAYPRTATGMDGTLTLIFAISETLRYIKMF